MTARPRVRTLWILSSFLLAPGCSAITDFDRFEGQGGGAQACSEECAPDLPDLVPDTRPGFFSSPTVRSCSVDSFTAGCVPGGIPEAFFRLTLPVPRLIRMDLERGDGGRILRPRAISAYDQGGAPTSCDLGFDQEFVCANSVDDALPLEQVFFPGTYVFAVDVTPEVGSDAAPNFSVRSLIDPQTSCETAPVLEFPVGGDELVREGSTVGARSQFNIDFVGPDHVYEIVVAERAPYRIFIDPIDDELLGPEEFNHSDPALIVRTACEDDSLNILALDDDGRSEEGDPRVDLYPSISVELPVGSSFLVVEGFDTFDDGSYALVIRQEELLD